MEDISLSNPDNFTINLSNITSGEGRSKPIARRNALGRIGSKTSRDLDGNLTEALIEIEKKCSSGCFSLIKKLFDDYKKAKGMSAETEKKYLTIYM